MKVLGIETSCDDTGIALLEGRSILANVILKQEHKKGVIPEYAARAHHVALADNLKKIINEHGKPDLVAYTNEPGLIGSLFVGTSFAKSFAYASQIPCIGVNHLEAHLILPKWTEQIEFPYLCLLISGGHTMLIYAKDLNDYEIFSTTLDDAVGETFDKVARHLGLIYPGGPEIEKKAKEAKEKGINKFPKVMVHSNNFSFSGLKTAAIEQIDKETTEEKKATFCYDFQEYVAELLATKFLKIAKQIGVKTWVASGGVAANMCIRNRIEKAAKDSGAQAYFPPIDICTDNGLMVAVLGEMLYHKNGPSALDLRPKAQFEYWRR